MQLTDLIDTPVSANLEKGELCAWVMIDTSQSVFIQQTSMRKALESFFEIKRIIEMRVI